MVFWENGIEISRVLIEDGQDGNDGLSSLVNVVPNTPDGDSTTIEIGIDDNGNGVLESTEVDQTFVVSDGTDGTNGTNGQDGLTSYVSVDVNLDCEYGGFIITSWLDNNGDGVYDESEDTLVETVEYCNPTPEWDSVLICHEMSGQQNAGTYDEVWNDYDYIQLTMTFSEYTYHKLVVHGGQSTQNDTFGACDPNDGTILYVDGGLPTN